MARRLHLNLKSVTMLMGWFAIIASNSRTDAQPPGATNLSVPGFLPNASNFVGNEGTTYAPPTLPTPNAYSTTNLPEIIQFPATPANNDVQFSMRGDVVSLTARNAALDAVLGMISQQQGLNLVTSETINERITVQLTEVPLPEVLDAILETNGYVWSVRGRVIIVSKVSNQLKLSPATQGRVIRVFPLNFVTADEVDKVVQGLLSPLGKSFVTSAVSSDTRRAQELLTVEDLPASVQRIEAYVRSVDIPPKQVVIESHVLQVQLKGENRNGVNWSHLFSLAGANVTLQTTGLRAGGPPVSVFQIENDRLTSVIDALQSTTDSKTLAAPKVAAINGQEARMQVGGRIGYLLTTTTQTSTLQSVNFLDIGVILRVTPYITDDGRIMMKVHPNVSSGKINATTSLPETETTEVETTVMLRDGQAIVIGGLIKETDLTTESKVPILGNIWLLGRLFKRSETIRERNEIIITLRPQILNDGGICPPEPDLQVQQAYTPLLYGDLQRMNRREFEPEFPCSDVPRRQWNTHVPPSPETYLPMPIQGQPVVPAGVYIFPNAQVIYPQVPSVYQSSSNFEPINPTAPFPN